MIKNHASAIRGRGRAKLGLWKARTKARLPRPALQIAGVHTLLVEIQIAVDDVILLIREVGRDRLHWTDGYLAGYAVGICGGILRCNVNQLCYSAVFRRKSQRRNQPDTRRSS